MPLLKDMEVVAFLDTILVPLSLFLTLGYHAYLWHSFKNKPCNTTIGINALRRTAWFHDIKEVTKDIYIYISRSPGPSEFLKILTENERRRCGSQGVHACP
jgi:hypothetical protein